MVRQALGVERWNGRGLISPCGFGFSLPGVFAASPGGNKVANTMHPPTDDAPGAWHGTKPKATTKAKTKNNT